MVAIGRRGLVLGVSALALGATLGACNGSGASGGLTADDMVLGSDDAPVTLIEYASTTCPHCAEFHETVWEQLKTTYIDAGRVRFVFREFPTPPPAIALAGFQVARCGAATPEQYFIRLDELFRQQAAMFATGSIEGIRAKLIEIGGAAGLSEQQITQCINDQAGQERVRRLVEAGQQQGVTGTPTFFINGARFEQAPTYENLARALDAAGA